MIYVMRTRTPGSVFGGSRSDSKLNDEIKPRTAPPYYLVQTDATCVNESLGELCLGYINGSLSPEDRNTFEAHMLECVACETEVSNWKSLADAILTFHPDRVESHHPALAESA